MLVLGLTGGHKLGLGLVAGGFIVFALVTSMVIPRFRPDFPGSRNGVRLYAIAALMLFVGTLAAVEGFAKEQAEAEAAGTETAPAKAAAGNAAVVAAGKKVFLTAGCTACHTLKDANSHGNVGPNLDEAKPSKDIVVARELFQPRTG